MSALSSVGQAPWNSPTSAPQQFTPQTPQQQGPPEPFTTADGIQLAKYQQAKSQADEQLATGDIDQQTHGLHMQNIGPQLQKLMAKQQAFQGFQGQQAKAQAMDQAATQEAIRGVHMKTRAQDFRNTLGEITDPVTGAHTIFTQDQEGNFKEVKHEAYQAQEDRKAKDRGVKPSSMARGEAPPTQLAVGDTEPEQPPPNQDLGAAAAQTEPMTLDQKAQQMRAVAIPEQPSQEIPNEFGTQPVAPGEPQIITGQEHGGVKLGENPADFTYNKFGEVQRGAQPSAGQYLEQEFMRRAQNAIRRPQMTGNPHIDAHNMALWGQQVQSMATHLLTDHQINERHKADQEALSQEHQRGEASRSAEHRRHEAAMMRAKEDTAKAKAKEGITLEWEQKNLARHERVVANEVKDYQDRNPGKPIPDYLQDPRKRAEERHEVDVEYWRQRIQKRGEAGTGPLPADDGQHGEPPGGVATKPPPQDLAPAPVVPQEVWDQPSVIPRERLQDVIGKINAARETIPTREIVSPLSRKLISMGDVLENAISRGHLTKGERKVYENHLDELDKMMKKHGHDADNLKLVD